MEDYDTPDDFEVEINTGTRKRKAPEADKTKKPKWKSGEIEMLIGELEKRSFLRDVFGKDYHWGLKLLTRPLAKFCWMKCWKRLPIPPFNIIQQPFNSVQQNRMDVEANVEAVC